MIERFNRYWKDEGIVIRSTNFGERDRLVTLFTRGRGKTKALAKGARKIGNRFGASLDIFNYSQFMFYSGAGMPILMQGLIKFSYRDLAFSLKKWLEGNYLLYLLDRCWQWEKPEERLLERVLYFWEVILKKGEEAYPSFLQFKLDLAFYLGITPHLGSCVVCNKTIEGEAYWSNPEGGIICPSCAREVRDKVVISQDLRAILGYLSSRGNSSSLKLSPSQFENLDKILSDYLTYEVGDKVGSWHDFQSLYQGVAFSS
ncbi:MAG: repair protein RecO [Candidatus Atribacteria bacterium]|nr:repair protein RecO [Candidatus Atribacteria bacterium]